MCTSVRTEWEANKRSNSTNCGGPVDEWNARAMTRRTTTATAIKVHSQNPTRSHNGTYGFAALNSVLKLHSLCHAEKTVYLFLRSVIYRRKTNSRNHKTTCSRYCCSQPRDQLYCDLPGRSRSRETGSSSDCDNAIGTSLRELPGIVQVINGLPARVHPAGPNKSESLWVHSSLLAEIPHPRGRPRQAGEIRWISIALLLRRSTDSILSTNSSDFSYSH